jgi:hypothetical protein
MISGGRAGLRRGWEPDAKRASEGARFLVLGSAGEPDLGRGPHDLFGRRSP